MNKARSLLITALLLGTFSFANLADAQQPKRNKPLKNTAPVTSTVEPETEVSPHSVGSSVAELRPNAVVLELLGKAGLYSFAYDRMLTNMFAVGAGLSYFSASSGGADASIFVIPLYGSVYFFEGNSRFFITGGFDIISVSGRSSGDITFSGSGVAPFIAPGFEYRADSGFVFRATLPYILLGKFNDSIWFGLSFGYAF